MFLGSRESGPALGRRQSWELRTPAAQAVSSLPGHGLAAPEQGWIGDSDRIQGQGPCQGIGAGATGSLQTQLDLNQNYPSTWVSMVQGIHAFYFLPQVWEVTEVWRPQSGRCCTVSSVHIYLVFFLPYILTGQTCCGFSKLPVILTKAHILYSHCFLTESRAQLTPLGEPLFTFRWKKNLPWLSRDFNQSAVCDNDTFSSFTNNFPQIFKSLPLFQEAYKCK